LSVNFFGLFFIAPATGKGLPPLGKEGSTIGKAATQTRRSTKTKQTNLREKKKGNPFVMIGCGRVRKRHGKKSGAVQKPRETKPAVRFGRSAKRGARKKSNKYISTTNSKVQKTRKGK